MNKNSGLQNIIRLYGFDSAGEVFLSNGRVLRGIYPGSGKLYRQVLSVLQQNNLFQYGIVLTHEMNESLMVGTPYEMILEHEKVPFISYPHEWPSTMLRDAAMFHIELFLVLEPYGLTLKDWHPYNILFKGVEPIFVDFLSIIPLGNLTKETYLSPPHIPAPFERIWDAMSAYVYEMYRRMYVPYFLLPLYFMRRKQHSHARQRLFETTMNAARAVMTEAEVFSANPEERKKYRYKELIKRLALLQSGTTKSWFWRLLKSELSEFSVEPKAGSYQNYYIAKGEEFNFDPSPQWTNKQHVVNNAIRELKPKTMLDVGSNTGWFSVLATKLGCQVVALDLDEACVDALYRRAKQENLPILPLVANLIKLTPDVAPLIYENEPSLSLIGGDSPLIISAEKRLKCEMVLALAIVHHLALGSGLRFKEIVILLENLTEKHLLVEFVAKDDELIVAEPTFFPSYSKNPQEFSWYTLENFLVQLRSVFRSIDIKLSYPDSRYIIICTK